MTEEEIRRIVREEIRDAFALLAEEADGFSGYETDRIDDAAAYVMKRVVDGTTSIMRHEPTCSSRTERWGRCDCGADE